MAMINCSKCKEEVSDKAYKCPKCGQQLRMSILLKVILCTVATIVAGLTLVAYTVPSVTLPETKPEVSSTPGAQIPPSVLVPSVQTPSVQIPRSPNHQNKDGTTAFAL